MLLVHFEVHQYSFIMHSAEPETALERLRAVAVQTLVSVPKKVYEKGMDKHQIGFYCWRELREKQDAGQMHT